MIFLSINPEHFLFLVDLVITVVSEPAKKWWLMVNIYALEKKKLTMIKHLMMFLGRL